MVSSTITLTAQEQQLRDLLVQVARHIDASPNNDTNKEPVILRWAGGWVRDKLLGIESHDIDTAINNLTGEAFVGKLREYVDIPGNKQLHRLQDSDIGRLHTVARNPDKSKHLETSTIKLCGLDVDFVNLRMETYTEDSRNPTVEFGTAEEDARRRDATVNALFYNLATGEVEDLVGGLPDLEAGIIRTPMEPLQTFMDDPLRVLRLVRFASRLGFKIDKAAEVVMADENVLKNLKIKISRERIGVELEKMLKGKHPVESLRLINRLGLYHAVFTVPERTDMPKPDISKWDRAYECLLFLESNNTPGSIWQLLVTTEEARYFAWALATLTPWEQLPDDPPLKPGKAAFPLATQAAREGFKAPNKLSDVVTAAHRHRPAILELKAIVEKKTDEMKDRAKFGMAIREWDARAVGSWRLQVLYSILVDVEQRTGSAKQEEVLLEWQGLLDHLVELDLMQVASLKRICDGKYLSKALGVRPGVWTGAALNVVMQWQLKNPGVEDPAGAVEENTKRVQKALLATLTCLQQPDKIQENASDQDKAWELAKVISTAIAPVLPALKEDTGLPASFDDALSNTSKALNNHCKATATLGLECLKAIDNVFNPHILDDDTVLTLIAYSDPDQNWSDNPAKTAKLVNDILKTYPFPNKADFITSTVLQSYLRPLFSKSKPSTITSSGRKAEYQTDNSREGIPDDTAATKPWKFTDLRSIPVFSWAVTEADDALISTHWPSYIPVLLTLVDDSTTSIRQTGLTILTNFLFKIPAKTLQDTGLGQVFADAVFPTLSYLPSLTPEDESLQLLKPAYEALLVLAGKQPTTGNAKNAMLDKLIREGIFTGYFHAKSHVKIVELLCRETVEILGAMGVGGVKHLKDLIPMISAILTDPFASAAPLTLLSAIQALQAVLRNCWPRLLPGSVWHDEIINALVLCWLNLDEPANSDDGGSVDEIRKELVTSAQALSAIAKTAGTDLSAEVAPLVAKTASLAGLFSMPS
ncbi:mitochondrial CCA tRNA nucleotidyltransferase [Triangularia verruculosa]|uniref:Mitochondrial CCA tRNA nucleotidyltransferase n=1 Tax=Triangularia verruculosa TaxID=2587418 RepID=A0AAN6XFJ4_9PEZI|nr:mitochondrial CCA tRNA nucleotidyltransferase [Triangularia verruculosa]